MAADLPEGLAIEPIWVLEASYTPEARERRPAARVEHLTRIAKLRAEGVLIEAGGYFDWSGALLLLRVPDEESALALAREDIYARAGVWTNFRARQLGRVIREDEAPTGTEARS